MARILLHSRYQGLYLGTGVVKAWVFHGNNWRLALFLAPLAPIILPVQCFCQVSMGGKYQGLNLEKTGDLTSKMCKN
ncbi:hypothetical protein CBP51_04130 [Cellvibrio mixtus]|uniref:Uncharacterized protein n=1 Tax=Cellvibrio mixtus TaxID=39650 RepID=A0A266Q8Q4_9GAMM|nr:hypothetical protein CBP51_04130 [Cellvibrio mixtus]